jgi:hypothetical protein
VHQKLCKFELQRIESKQLAALSTYFSTFQLFNFSTFLYRLRSPSKGAADMGSQLDGKVLKRELEAIRARRRAVFAGTAQVQLRAALAASGRADASALETLVARAMGEPADDMPVPDDEGEAPADPIERKAFLKRQFARAHATRPFGLCFSGGGIRSATFNLGILQGLADRGLLKYVDYLSTVSGGGYIGSWMHGVIRNRHGGDVKAAEAALSARQNPVPTTPDDDPIAFLRKYSNYLAPRPGLFSADSWVIGSIWLRNVFLNQLILVPTLCALVLLLLLAGFAQQLPPRPPLLDAVLIIVQALVGFAALGLAVRIAVVNLQAIKERSFPPDEGQAPRFDAQTVTRAVRRSNWVPPLVFASALILACAGLEAWRAWTAPVVSAGILGLMLVFQFAGGFPDCYEHLRRNDPSTTGAQRRRRAAAHVAWMSTLASSLTVGLILLTWQWLPDIAPGTSAAWQRLAFGPPMMCAAVFMGVALLIGFMGADYPDAAREWISRTGASVLLLCAGWMALFVVAVFGPFVLAWLLDWYALVAVTAMGGWAATTAAGVLLGRSARPAEGGPPGVATSAANFITAIAPTVFMVGYLLLVACGVHVFVSLAANRGAEPGPWVPHTTPTVYDIEIAGAEPSSTQVRLRTSDAPEWLGAWLDPVVRFEAAYWYVLGWNPATIGWMVLLLAGAAAIAVVASKRFNINEFSLHHFYKNRIVRCYLGASNSKSRQPNTLTGFDPNDDFPISTLLPEQGYYGPYGIVNTALNLNTGSELAQQERKAASFIFSPGFCGFEPVGSREDAHEVARSNGAFEKTGYRATAGYSSPQGPALGTAVAISGAAASPNSGFHTSGPMAFLLTVFDGRLGWWLGNPRRPGPSRKSGPDFAWGYLFKELLGLTTGRSEYVNLSDGGHFENLGLYELVRRRCRYIIVGDGEHDPNTTFEALGSAIRRCRADFGVEIDIDPQPLRVVTGMSKAHCVVGTIRYPEDEAGWTAGLTDGRFVPGTGNARGWLLYLKSSVTGDEPADVLEYRSQHPEFPHQPTSDQFFSESQFESYRRLGLHVVSDTFAGVDAVAGAGDPDDLRRVFQELTRKWYAPVPVSLEAATRLADGYTSLIRRLGDNADLAALAPQLLPQHQGPSGPTLSDAQALIFGLEAIQLMQNVFTEFHLGMAANRANPRNAGWMTVFRRWVQSSVLYDTIWKNVRDDYNPMFQQFVDELREPANEWPDRP